MVISDLNSLSVAERVGQLFFIGIPGPELDAATKELIEEVKPGGICLFARNIRDAAQTRELLDALRGYLGYEPLLSVDQEGGTVDRLRRIMTPMPSASQIKTADEAAEFGSIVAETLRLLGFNMDFAPVVDVVDERRSQISKGLAGRTFGHSKEDVTKLAGAFLDALQAGGIVGCLKHFPGLGGAGIDSHEDLPQIAVSDAELTETDLFPYKTLIANGKARSVMAAHAAFPNLALQETGQNGKLLPSSLSYNFVTTLLRGELAFDGLVITDDLEMGAIIKNYGIGDASKMAIKAGVDMLAICAGADAIRNGFHTVLKAANEGELDSIDRSVERISNLRKDLSPPLPFDLGRLDVLSSRTAELKNRLGC
jgi:beta-N-acetylhexosaminidase